MGSKLTGEKVKPVRLPPGRARLATKPDRTGSPTLVKTIGIVEVACFAASAKPARLGYISLPLPARTSWLTVYRSLHPARVGIFLSCRRNTPGAYAMEAILDEWKAGGAVKDELGETVTLAKTTLGNVDTIIDRLQVESLEQPDVRKKAFSWLAERVNKFVNVLRPRMRSAAADYQSRGE